MKNWQKELLRGAAITVAVIAVLYAIKRYKDKKEEAAEVDNATSNGVSKILTASKNENTGIFANMS